MIHIANPLPPSLIHISTFYNINWEAGVATGEASLTLASLVRVPWEEGSGHAWLLL